jgi:hypothetical protein
LRVVRRSFLAFSACLVCLVAPASANTFSYPSPADPTIRVPNAIGGIHIGERLDAAQRAWGGGRGSCRYFPSGVTTCTYGNNRDRGRGVAYFSAQGSRPSSRIYQVTIAAGLKLGVVPVYRGPLMRIRTKEGIGLGSTARRLRHVYPQVRTDSIGFHVRRKKVEIDFETFNSENHHTVTTIDVFRVGNFG